MYRIKIWTIGYLPLIIGIVAAVYAGLGVGAVIMTTSIFTVPVAIKMEEKLLKERGVDFENGSSSGNVLAKVLGVIVIIGVLWLFGFMIINVIKLNV